MARRPKPARRKKPLSPRISFARAFAVHIFTALGGACALMALVAATRSDFTAMFAWLGAALFIDGIDGTFARRLDVARAAPRWSGDALDFVVDFTTYVFVPAYALVQGGLLPPAVAIPLAAAIVVSSALYFADREMKTADYHFKGFPALWNGVAFHLFLLKLDPWIAAGLVIVLIALTFAPVKFVHPMRVVRLRGLTLAVVIAWSLLALLALIDNLNPHPAVAWLVTLCGLYLVGIGALMPSRREAN
jgi:phosphatidylcholine synthase